MRLACSADRGSQPTAAWLISSDNVVSDWTAPQRANSRPVRRRRGDEMLATVHQRIQYSSTRFTAARDSRPHAAPGLRRYLESSCYSTAKSKP